MFQANGNKNRNHDVGTIFAAQKTNEVQNVTNCQSDGYVDYKRVFESLVPTISGHKDLINFSYFLYKMNYVDSLEQDHEEFIAIKEKVSFCDCCKCKSRNDTMNVDRLSQQYIVDMFGGNYYTSLWVNKDSILDRIVGRCESCEQKGKEEFPFCPYFLTYYINQYAKTCNRDPELIYDTLLGAEKIIFKGVNVNQINCYVDPEEYQGIYSKNAHAAYLLLASKLIHVCDKSAHHVSYTYLPICQGKLRSNIISDIIDFWKTSSGVHNTIYLDDMGDILVAGTYGCGKCDYTQCPHKLAAYFVVLGEKYGVDPIDLAYYIATQTTHAGLKVSDNYQYHRFQNTAIESSMKKESKDEYCKMLNYIVGRSKNINIPFLAFNMTILSADKTYGMEIADEFCNALWHFDYYNEGRDHTNSHDIYLAACSFDELLEQYATALAGTTFRLYDTHLMCENDIFKGNYHRLLKIMLDRNKQIMSIIVGEKEEVYRFFRTYPEFKNKIFTKELEILDMSPESVSDKLLGKLEETFTIPEDEEVLLRHYINVSYSSSSLKSIDYVNDLYEKLLFNHYNHDVNADNVLKASDIPYIKPPRSEQEIFGEINKLIGLQNVKQELKDINNLVKFNIKMGNNKKNSMNLHMVFSGNPGTGKTTVARLVAEILHSIGFIRENKVITCSAKDLIGQYLGTTAPKTAKKCEQAYNGVLFIDEAYQLNPYTSNVGDSYKEECIAELIQQMENNRDKLVVIFAGYTDEMEDFLNRANTGLKSRIGKTLEFPDYSSEELFEIFESIAKSDGMTLGEGVRGKTMFFFEKAKENAERFGNARYARNMYERSRLRHATIKSDLDENDPALRILEGTEIVSPELYSSSNQIKQ